MFRSRAAPGCVSAALLCLGTLLRLLLVASDAEPVPSEPHPCACAAVESQKESEVQPADSPVDFEGLVPPKAIKVERTSRGLRVLILGDSLALCGFGKTLDTKLRKLEQVESVSTYMACGSVPTTWLRTGPLANAQTGCGYWSIEGSRGKPIKEVRDTFGMERGKRPGIHSVPKLEKLAEALQPDILVMQNGTNLLSLFSDGQTILPARHGGQIRSYMSPFVQQLAQSVHSLQKVYWVAPPVTERVSPEVQDFLFLKMQAYASPLITFIDSRTLVSHPYQKPMPDREHFIGKDMEVWAEKVFKLVEADIEGNNLGRVSSNASGTAENPSLSSVTLDHTGALPSAARARVNLHARLLVKSQPLPLEKINPYQESMVVYLYQVERVLSGNYAEKELLVMHPAHISQKPEPLEKFTVGEVYELDLLEFEGSPWEAIKRSEQTGRLELLPFIRKEDEARFPSGGR